MKHGRKIYIHVYNDKERKMKKKERNCRRYLSDDGRRLFMTHFKRRLSEFTNEQLAWRRMLVTMVTTLALAPMTQ